MNRVAGFVLLLLPFGLCAPAMADELLQSSRSAGKLRADESIVLSKTLREHAPVTRPAPVESENYASSADAQQFEGIANRHDQLFEIYSADVRLLSDLDGDGFHHALSVSFDVDVNYDSANVYAKLYLSREGGPWGQYFTTELFHIDGDSTADIYEVETELLEGYAAGYYNLLIEIYSLDHAYMVASEVLDYHYLGKDLMLEDLDRDSYHGHVQGEVHVSAGAGSFGGLLAFFLVIQFVIAARGALANSVPCKKRRERITKRFPALRSP